MATTLGQAIDATQDIFDVSSDELLTGKSYPVRVTIGSEILYVTGAGTASFHATARTRWSVERGADGSTAASHAVNAAVTAADLGTGGGAGGVTIDNLTDPPAEVTTLVSAGATIAGSEATLRGKDFYAQDDDPGAVGAGSVWKDTTSLQTQRWWERNEANDGWDAVFQPTTVATGAAIAVSNLAATTEDGVATATSSAAAGSGDANVGINALSDSGSASAIVSAESTTDGNADASSAATSGGGGDVDTTSTSTTATGGATSGVVAVRGADEASVKVAATALGAVSVEIIGDTVHLRGALLGGADVAIGDDGSVVITGALGATLTMAATGSISLQGANNDILLNLPTADPVAAGVLWSDAGTVKVSAG